MLKGTYIKKCLFLKVYMSKEGKDPLLHFSVTLYMSLTQQRIQKLLKWGAEFSYHQNNSCI